MTEPSDIALPFDPENSPIAAMRVRIDMVREARLIFGPQRAAALWHRLGLPDMPEQSLPDMGERDEAAAFACLSAILSFRPEADAPMLGLITLAAEGDARADRLLKESGIRVELTLFDQPGIIVANRAKFLALSFEQTPWSDYRWAAVLRGLPRWRSPGVKRFGKGPVSHGIFIPMDVLPV